MARPKGFASWAPAHLDTELYDRVLAQERRDRARVIEEVESLL